MLAGGAATRMGGAKATALLHGRPLLDHAIAALHAAGLTEVVVTAKADTPLPDTTDAEILLEPSEPQHPLMGVRTAQGRAPGRPLLTLPVDTPCVSSTMLLALIEHAAKQEVVALRGHPLIARWPAGFEVRPEGRAMDVPTTWVELTEPILNLNTPADLRAACQVVRTARDP